MRDMRPDEETSICVCHMLDIITKPRFKHVVTKNFKILKML